MAPRHCARRPTGERHEHAAEGRRLARAPVASGRVEPIQIRTQTTALARGTAAAASAARRLAADRRFDHDHVDFLTATQRKAREDTEGHAAPHGSPEPAARAAVGPGTPSRRDVNCRSTEPRDS